MQVARKSIWQNSIRRCFSENFACVYAVNTIGLIINKNTIILTQHLTIKPNDLHMTFANFTGLTMPTQS